MSMLGNKTMEFPIVRTGRGRSSHAAQLDKRLQTQRQVRIPNLTCPQQEENGRKQKRPKWNSELRYEDMQELCRPWRLALPLDMLSHSRNFEHFQFAIHYA